MSTQRKPIEEITLSSDESDAEKTVSPPVIPRIKLWSHRQGSCHLITSKINNDKKLITCNNSATTHQNDSCDIETLMRYQKIPNVATSSIINDSPRKGNTVKQVSGSDVNINETSGNFGAVEQLRDKVVCSTSNEQCRSNKEKQFNNSNVEAVKSPDRKEQDRNEPPSTAEQLDESHENFKSSNKIQAVLASLNTHLSKPKYFDKSSLDIGPEKEEKHDGAKARRIRIKHFALLHCEGCDFTKSVSRQSGNIWERPMCKQCNILMVYRCKTCGSSSNSAPALAAHLKKCQRATFWNCTECSFVSVKKTALDTHIKLKHTENVLDTVPGSSKFFHCTTCPRKYKTNDSLQRHSRMCKLKLSTVSTPKKPKSKEATSHTVTSEISVQPEVKTTPAVTDSSGSSSNQQLSTESKIRDEISSVLDLLILYCSDCSSYHTPDNNKTFCFTCYKPLLWQCVKCQLRSKSYCGIYEHVKKECERPYVCSDCNERFFTEDALTGHWPKCPKLIMACQFCNFTAKCKRTINKHIKSVHEENIQNLHPR